MSIFKRSSKNGIKELEPKEVFTIIEKNHNNPDIVVLMLAHLQNTSRNT